MEMAIARCNLILPLFLSLCLLVPIARSTDFHYCDEKADYDVKVSNIEISELKRGKPAIFNISASTTARTITKGTLVVDVSYFGFHVHQESHDLCKQTTCPVLGGDFIVSHMQDLPGLTPPGPYSLTMRMVDENGRELTCISFDFSIGLASSMAEI